MHIPSYHISDAARRRHDPLVVLLRVSNLRWLVRPFQPLMWLLFLPPPPKNYKYNQNLCHKRVLGMHSRFRNTRSKRTHPRAILLR